MTVFRRPSLDRHPFGWWRDPLQAGRVTLVATALWSAGAVCALPRADHRGTMIFWVLVAWSAGMFIGERIVFRRLGDRIV